MAKDNQAKTGIGGPTVVVPGGRVPPPLPLSKGQSRSPTDADTKMTIESGGLAAAEGMAPAGAPLPDVIDLDDETAGDGGSARRQAKRRPAGVNRGQIAANDDVPSIGGLIYALQQKPSQKPFRWAALATGGWLLIGALLAWSMLGAEFERLSSPLEIFARPALAIVLATISAPIAVFWVIAVLIWRAQELKLMSSAMTEVAIRLAEPDRTAEQAVASLGQAVRRQVGHMNDAVSMALGRAGELEALVHSEVSALERSYAENERRIRSLLSELQGERAALETTSDNVSVTLRAMGGEIPSLIEKLSSQQIKLSKIVEGAGQNLIALETSLGKASDNLEQSVGSRTNQLQKVLDDYTSAINTSLGSRTTQLQSVFEEYTRALDTTLASRAQALDTQLVERTRALDEAFSERLKLTDGAFTGRIAEFDDQIKTQLMAIDGVVGERARALTAAMESHADTLAQTLTQQAGSLDETLMHGINAVRRTSENITRQSVKAIEGLSGQADMLKNVSENLLQQIGGVTGRFENQGQSIMRAANALESANYRIDSTLANRHRELNETLIRLSTKTDEMDRIVQGYSSTLEGSMNEAEMRARTLTDQMSSGAQMRSQMALADLEQLKTDTESRTQRALEDLRGQFGSVTREVDAQLGGLTSRVSQTQEALRGQFGSVNREVDAQLGLLTNRFGQTSDELRQVATRAASEFEAEQERIRAEAARLPRATRDSADGMRKVLNEQLAALDQLSSLSSREMQRNDIAAPVGGPQPIAALPTVAKPAYQPARGPMPSGPVDYAPYPAQPPQRYAPIPQGGMQPAPQGAARAGWSVGDLLARASHGDGSQAAAHAAADQHGPALNIENIARALDPATASAIWARIRAGQNGFMVRSIYPAEARGTFDEVAGRYRMNAEFRMTVDRFLADFDQLIAETGGRDPSGRVVNGHLISDSGRVYLFLAHASGRIG